ncbi:MAG: transposase, partial [Deltaproteobacteria bacterium]|nr:transposase [Deltaproteobacteria bacterium]
MDSKIRNRKQTHLSNFDYTNSAFMYFITICTANKQSYFLNPSIARIISDELEFRKTNKEIKLFCYCIMPDHLHILLSLSDDYQKSLQAWVSTFKRYTARVTNELHAVSPLWQKNFYDHIVRKEESLFSIVKYIVNNP